MARAAPRTRADANARSRDFHQAHHANLPGRRFFESLIAGQIHSGLLKGLYLVVREHIQRQHEPKEVKDLKQFIWVGKRYVLAA